MLEFIIVTLTLMMIIGALVAIETPNLLYSVISVGAVGFLLSIVFLFLAAPDLAITQIAVEVIERSPEFLVVAVRRGFEEAGVMEERQGAGIRRCRQLRA